MSMNKARHRRESCGVASHPGFNSTISGHDPTSRIMRLKRALASQSRQPTTTAWAQQGIWKRMRSYLRFGRGN